MSNVQWPTLPMPTDAEPEPGDSSAIYTLLIEESTGSGDSIRWTASRLSTITWRDRSEARREAMSAAWRYAPQHPMAEQRRAVYRINPDEWLVIVEGATASFAFRVMVAEPMGMRGG